MVSVILLVLAAFLPLVFAQDTAALAKELASAVTANDRFDILSKDPKNFVFDFGNPKGPGGITTGLDGHTVAANVKTFPLLTDSQVGMTLGFLVSYALLRSNRRLIRL